ncbi:YfcE family phosphodiesterase [Oscillospiraceae bacterium LTW-04]|nr:YfcE family phosphodiesterase [Oscillospiraceae bacterium MB24-C1]
MRILVVSDTHHDFDTLYRLVLREKDRIDLLLHLGDGAQDVDDLRAVWPLLSMRFVRGNCDYTSTAPDTAVVEADGVRLLLTHGHLFNVNYTTERLAAEARRQNATVALFGHTHRQLCRSELGVQVMNPGSLSKPRDGKFGYGVIETVQGQPVCSLHRFE